MRSSTILPVSWLTSGRSSAYCEALKWVTVSPLRRFVTSVFCSVCMMSLRRIGSMGTLPMEVIMISAMNIVEPMRSRLRICKL